MIPTPFHSRTKLLCESQEWRNWSGYMAAVCYEPSHTYEYYAIRNSAALIDVSPLFKYEISGPQALAHVNRIMTRDVSRCAEGQIMYSPWCDDKGKVIDDGVIARLGEDHFRVTSADPNLTWFQHSGCGLDSSVVDVSADLAAVSLQGPNSIKILTELLPDTNLVGLRYYHLLQTRLEDFYITVSRNGYTGDLGYELWVDPAHAERLWDLLMDVGNRYGITPAGLAALDVARIEAGLLLIEVDYISSRKALIDLQKSSPYEIGLGWTVDLSKRYFTGKLALEEEKRKGSQWAFVGLEVEWDSLEALFTNVDLAPQLAGRASRSAVPIYKDDQQIGQSTSHTFSPILKKYIHLGTIRHQDAKIGNRVEIEFTVEYIRQKANAIVVKTPFFNPLRKRA
jgi:aminomethyltransferase